MVKKKREEGREEEGREGERERGREGERERERECVSLSLCNLG
jgi:hypothetical protein